MMRTIAKIFKTILVLLLICLGLLAFAFVKAESFLTVQLRSQLAELLGPQGVQVDFKSLKLDWQWGGIQVRLQNVGVFGTNCSQIDVEEVSFSLSAIGDYAKPKELVPDLRVLVKNPTLTCDLSTSKAQEPAAPVSVAPIAIQQLTDLRLKQPFLKDLRLDVSVEKLNLELRRESHRLLVLKDISSDFRLENLSSPLKMNLTGMAKLDQPAVPFWLVFSFASDFNYQNGKIIFDRMLGQVLSLTTSLKGEIDLNNRSISILAKSQITDLQKIPPPPQNLGLPIIGWSGALDSEVKVEGPFQSLSYQGFFRLAKSQIMIDMRSEESIANGEFNADLAFDFKGGQFFEIKDYSADFNLTDMNISFGKIFNKPSEIPLTFKSKGHIDRRWVIDSLFAKLNQLETDLKGQVDLSPGKSTMASLQIFLHPTTLSGLERFILPLSAHPVTGSASLKGSFEGDLRSPAKGKIEISDLTLKNVSTQVRYGSRSLLIDGPLELNLEGKLSADNLNVQSGKATLKADLSGMSISYLNLFSKKQAEPFKIAISAEKNQGFFSLKSSQIQTKAGAIEIAGQPPLSVASPMNLRLDCKSLNLTQLKTWLPSLRPHVPDGELKFSLGLNGRLDPEFPMKSLLAVKGTVAGRLPKYVVVKSEPAVKVQTLVEKPKPPPAFLTDENLIHNTQIAIDLIVDEFEVGDLKAAGVHMKSDLKAGQVESALSVARVFGGSVSVSRLSLNLFQPDPILKYELKATSVQIESLLNWAMPQYEKLIGGKVDLSSQGLAKLPWAPDFTESILADGDFSLAQGRLNTVELAAMVKDFVAKVPGAKADAIASKGPLQAQMKGNYKIKDGQLGLNPFSAVTSQNDEISFKGFVDYTLNMNLTGTAHIKSDLSGSFFEANKDSQGRLEIPFRMQGSPLKPEFAFAQDTLSKMANKVLAYEQKKIVQGIESKVNDEVQKKKQEVTEDLKKKVQDLFIKGN